MNLHMYLEIHQICTSHILIVFNIKVYQCYVYVYQVIFISMPNKICQQILCVSNRALLLIHSYEIEMSIRYLNIYSFHRMYTINMNHELKLYIYISSRYKGSLITLGLNIYKPDNILHYICMYT